MKFISPSSITEKDLQKLDVLGDVPSDEEVLGKAMGILVPYYEVAVFSTGKPLSTTCFNAFLPIENISLEDLLLFFRPNFLGKKRKKRKTAPPLSTEETTVLPPLPFSPEKLHEKISHFARDVKRMLRDVHATYQDQIFQDAGFRRFVPSQEIISQEAREKRNKTRDAFHHLSSLSILLKETLNINNLTDVYRFKEKELFYYPYVLIKRGEKYLLIDAVKRGLLFKKIIVDKGLSRILNQYESAKRKLKQEVSIPELLK